MELKEEFWTIKEPRIDQGRRGEKTKGVAELKKDERKKRES